MDFSRRQLLHTGGLVGIGSVLPPVSDRPSEDQSLSLTLESKNPESDCHPKPISYPSDPFILTTRGTFEPAEKRVPSILGIHPDALSLPRRGGLDFSLKSSIPATTGSFTHIDLVERDSDPLYERLRRKGDWRYPDGTPVEKPTGIVARKLDGSLHGQKSDTSWRAVPSIFADPTFELVTSKASRRLQRGFAGVLFGNTRMLREFGLDFSVWAQDAFQEHLETISAEKRRSLGIADPSSFDIRAYLDQHNLAPDAGRNPATNPVFREYLLHQHMGIQGFFDRLNDWLKTACPDVKPPLHASQPIGDPTLSNAAVVETYLSEHMDFIHTEDWRTIPSEKIYYPSQSGGPAEWRPPIDIRDFVYKLMLAAGGFERQVHVNDAGFGGSYYTGLGSDQRYPMLLRLQAAEAYAMGAQRDLLLSGDGPLDWLRGDGTLSPRLQEFIDFLWAHQRFLSNTTPDNPVAVIWSLPTLLWNTLPQWNRAAMNHTRTFHGVVTLLREAQYSYDVLVLGHPELMSADATTERLSNYDSVVLPAVDCITSAQLETLEDYLTEDGHLISSGSPPDRDGTYDPLEEAAELFDHENVQTLPSNPGRQRREDGESDGSFINALTAQKVDPMTTTANLGVNQLTQPESNRRIIHLLNYDYDPETDEFDAKSDIGIRIDEDGTIPERARFFSPQQIEDVQIVKSDGRTVVTVPEVIEWGFIVLGSADSNFIETGLKQEAQSTIQQASERLDVAIESTDKWSVRLALAQAALREAEIARDYKAYSLAIEAGEQASSHSKGLASPRTAKMKNPRDFDNSFTSPKTGESTTTEGMPGFTLISTLLGMVAAIVSMKWFHKNRE